MGMDINVAWHIMLGGFDWSVGMIMLIPYTRGKWVFKSSRLFKYQGYYKKDQKILYNGYPMLEDTFQSQISDVKSITGDNEPVVI